jgi:hypothetical protein
MHQICYFHSKWQRLLLLLVHIGMLRIDADAFERPSMS